MKNWIKDLVSASSEMVDWELIWLYAASVVVLLAYLYLILTILT